MANLWVLTHRDYGPLRACLSKKDANEALWYVLEDEPEWASVLTIEPFEFIVAEPPGAGVERVD